MPISQAMRAVVASDFCNGTSAVLDFRQWTFLNADLTVSMARRRSANGSCSTPNPGSGLTALASAMARLADVKGYFGRAIQSLVIEKR